MQIKPFSLPLVRIWISDKQIEHYRELVKQVSPNEVQWYSEVFEETHTKDKKEYINYVLEGMYVPEQTVTSVETDTDSDPMALYNIFKDLEKEHGEEKANEIIKRMHCWCHSHPFDSNKPKPSSTDDKTFESWAANNNSQNVEVSTVALIFSKEGLNIHGRVYNPKYPSIIFDDVEVKIYKEEAEDLDYITDLVKAKIKTKPTTTAYSNGHWVTSQGRYSFAPKEQAALAPAPAQAQSSVVTETALVPAKNPKVEIISKFNLQNTNKYFVKHLSSEWLETFEHSEKDNVTLVLWDFLQKIMNDEELTFFCELITEQSDTVVKSIQQNNLAAYAKRYGYLDILFGLFQSYMDYEYSDLDKNRHIVYIRAMIYYAKNALKWNQAEQLAGWQIIKNEICCNTFWMSDTDLSLQDKW
jgi:hypothetical protein